MNIIPAVDVLGGSVVRLVRGDYEAVTTYSDDPAFQTLAWSRQGAELVHVVDLDGARSGVPNRELWRRLGDTGVRFQVGGGLRSPDLVAEAVDAGAERVVVGTAALWEPSTLREMLDVVGPGRVVVAIDVRDGRATGAGWLDEGLPLAALLDRLGAQGVVRMLVTGIERDGTMVGPDVGLLALVRAAAPDMAIIASGGVGSLPDLRLLASIGVEGVIVGRALYEGRFTLEEALAVRP